MAYEARRYSPSHVSAQAPSAERLKARLDHIKLLTAVGS